MELDLFEPVGERPVIRCSRDPTLLIRSVEEWLVMAAPAGRDRHVKPGRSALECARAWFRDGKPQVPAELQAVFERRKETRGMRVASAIPEHKTFFSDGRFGPRNHDVLLFGTAGKNRTVVGVEAKADEALDRPLRKRIEGALKDRAAGKRTVFPERADRWCLALFGYPARDAAGRIDPRLADIPYQLLSGVAGTIVEAAHHRAAQAVFLVHVLDSGTLNPKKLDANERGLAAFCRLLGLDVPGGPDDWLLGKATYHGSDELPVMPLLVGIARGQC